MRQSAYVVAFSQTLDVATAKRRVCIRNSSSGALLMRNVFGNIVVLLVACTSNLGAQPSSGPALSVRLAVIKKTHAAAQAAYFKAAEALPNTSEGEKKGEELWAAFDKDQAAQFMAAVDLAKTEPKSDVGFDALEWVLTIPRAYYLPAGKPAMDLMTEHHAANPKIGKVVAWIGRLRPRQGETEAAAISLIKAVAEKNPDKTARGQAFLAIAWDANWKFGAAEFKGAPEADRLAAEAERIYEALIKDYGECPRLIKENGGTIGEFAKSELFELRHLRIGKIAPDITGEDLDGIKFKLSEYRGKVVVLDFWGDW
jgi:hypothetical protein